MKDNQRPNLSSSEHVYTLQEMTNASTIMPQNWTFFKDFQKSTSQTLLKALQERQDFKDQNNPFQDYNVNLRKTHRPDLWY